MANVEKSKAKIHSCKKTRCRYCGSTEKCSFSPRKKNAAAATAEPPVKLHLQNSIAYMRAKCNKMICFLLSFGTELLNVSRALYTAANGHLYKPSKRRKDNFKLRVLSRASSSKTVTRPREAP